MVSEIIKKINDENIEGNRSGSFSAGDTIKVHVNIREGDKKRVQIFAGTVIGIKKGKMGSFVVRRISHGVGVERVFPMNSPNIVKIEVENSYRIRRAKLYYLRDRTGKQAKLRGSKLK